MASVPKTLDAHMWTYVPAWLPLVGLPTAAAVLSWDSPPWMLMWTMAGAIYAGLKWLTFADCAARGQAPLWRRAGYLLLWPGMNARQFFATARPVEAPTRGEWLWALLKMAIGVVLFVVAIELVERHELVAGWIGMVGIVVFMHFGLFHVLSVVWRRAGIDAPAIMNNPIAARSLSDFWGRRWNLAVRDLAHEYVFLPLIKPLGVAGATLCVFLVSGLIHDVVISLPAGAGYGLPTIYFLVQGIGLLIERSQVGRRFALGEGIVGRVFCAALVLGSIALLFHRPFIERVVVPMLRAFEMN